jgi:hypothetical protein
MSPALMGMVALQVLSALALVWYLHRNRKVRGRILDSLRALIVFVFCLAIWFALYLCWHPNEREQIIHDLTARGASE